MSICLNGSIVGTPQADQQTVRIPEDNRSLWEKFWNTNREKIEYHEYRGRVDNLRAVLKADGFRLYHKVDVVETDEYIFHGVLPMKYLGDGQYHCVLDYWYKRP